MSYLETAALEDKLSILEKKWKEEVSKLYNGLKTVNQIDKVWKALLKSDPTKNKQYLQWIIVKGISKWRSKSERLFIEDLPVLKETLEKYNLLKQKNKLKPEHKDINRIKTDTESYGKLLNRTRIPRLIEIKKKNWRKLSLKTRRLLSSIMITKLK